FHRPPEAANLIRLLTDSVGEKGTAKRRIFISRSDAKIRQLLNEEEVMASLKPFGFESIVLTGMSLTEQIQVFRGAELVVGPHGAGLANVVFMQPGASVVEIISPARIWPTFKCIADRGQLNYATIAADSYSIEQTESRGEGNEDITVEADTVAKIVESLLKAH
ncbi:MAG: glycosyltransferase family 61 protein, partial [Proteobacteria bacterium]